MYEIKKVGGWSAAWVTSMLALALYLVLTVASLVINGITINYSNLILSIIFGIIIVEILGMIFGAILGWLYNLIAKHWGGLTIDLRHDSRK